MNRQKDEFVPVMKHGPCEHLPQFSIGPPPVFAEPMDNAPGDQRVT